MGNVDGIIEQGEIIISSMESRGAGDTEIAREVRGLVEALRKYNNR